MTDDNIDKQVADLIDALQNNDTQAIPLEALPNNDFFFSLTEDNHEQVIGQAVGHWQIEKLLGVGGMSVVYQVARLDDQINQLGALKVISDHFVYSSFKDRFFKERQILTDLNHPNIVKLLDAGITNTGIPWYVMEYIAGPDIKTYIESHQLNHEQIIDLIIPICDALICAHQFDVIHRDVKPSNVIINQDGLVKLFDFGIAHVMDDQPLNLTKTGVIIGTPGYMSPEQAKGLIQEINRSTDVFAMGVMLCELLTGEKPFSGNDVTEISYATIHHEPIVKTQNLSRDLVAIIYKCLQKDPIRRYENTEQLRQDLVAFRQSKVISARRITWHYRLKKLLQRHPKSSAAISILLFSILLSIAYAINQFYHNQQQLLFTEQVVNKANQISSEIQLTNLLPLHEVQPTYQRISKTATELADRLQNNQSLAGGSAYTALGMAFLSMRNPDQAKTLFHEAEAMNHDSTTLSRGLGLILSQEWRNAMEKKPDAETLINLKKNIYDPMILHLNKASEDQDFKHFILGNIAYLEAHYETAIEKFDLAYQQNPGFYDALRMKSEVQLFNWQNEVRQSGYVSTLSLLQSSNNTLQQAIEIGRSDPWNYVSLCSNKSAEIQILSQTKKTTQLANETKNAAQVCQDALILDPLAKSPWTNRSIILLSGLDLSATDDEKTAVYNEVIDWLEQAVIQHPTDERLLLSQIRPLMGLATVSLSQKTDPLPYFQKALKTLQQVKTINNHSSSRRMYNEFGRVHYSQAQYYVEQLKYEQAINQFQMTKAAYQSSQEIQFQNNIMFNLATVETELHDVYLLTNNQSKAIESLQSAVERRIPVIAENLDSYYPQLLDLLTSMVDLRTLNNSLGRNDSSLANHFLTNWKMACEFEGKTIEQLETINQLRKLWFEHTNESTLSPCLKKI